MNRFSAARLVSSSIGWNNSVQPTGIQHVHNYPQYNTIIISFHRTMCECTMSRVQTTEGQQCIESPENCRPILNSQPMILEPSNSLYKSEPCCHFCGNLMWCVFTSWRGITRSSWSNHDESPIVNSSYHILCLQWVPPHAFALYLFKLISGFQPSPTNHGACKWGQRSLAPAGIPATPCFSSFSLRNVTGLRKTGNKKNIASKEMLRLPIFRNGSQKVPLSIYEEETQHESFKIILFRLTQPSNPKHLTQKKTFPILHYHSPNSKHQLPMISFHQVLSMRNPRLAATRVVALPLEADGPTSDL